MSFVRLFKDDPKFRVEVSAVLVGILVLIVYGFQLCAMRSQLTVMQETLQIERPWVGPTGRKIVTKESIDPVTKKSIKSATGVAWYFQNGGRTPAIRTRIDVVVKMGPPVPVSLDVSRDSLPKNSECEKGELSEKFGTVTVLPGISNYSVNAVLEGADFPPSLDALPRDAKDLWLVGCIDYSDGSGKRWFRTNVLEYFDSASHDFAMWQTGNEAR